VTFRKKDRAYTILEILAVVAILSVLLALSFPALEKVRPLAERVICMNNLRNLRSAFTSYATDGWPQVPKEIKLGSLAEQRWWLEKTEKDLGLSKSSWQCPTIRRQFASAPEKDRPLIHYLPTPFSKEPNRANKSPQMPWFIEIGDAHGQGNLLVRQNGTVEPSPK
jgi:prepilin-type N-terminal cleavage/methylation domain-containing protein